MVNRSAGRAGKKASGRGRGRRKPEAVFVGADLGGTNIKCGVVSGSGSVLWSESRPLVRPDDREAVWEGIRDAVGAAVGAGAAFGPVRAIGVGAAAPLDWQEGRIFEPPNIRGLAGVMLADLLSDSFGVPAFLENDANAAAYGEFRCGAGMGSRTIVALTLGTGVGGGIVIEGSLYRGRNGVAAELGHTLVDPDGPPCGCGSRGCLEAYSSANSTVRRWREALASGSVAPPQGLSKPAESVTARDLFEFAEAGDEGARRAFSEAGKYLGEAVGSFVNAIDPDAVVLCGGMAGAAAHFMPALLDRFRKRAVQPARERVRIATGTLGALAGVAGAALLAAERRAGGRRPGRRGRG